MTRLTQRAALALAAAGLAGCSGTEDSASTSARETSAATDTATSTATTPDYDTSLPHDPTAWDGYNPDWTAPATSPEGDYEVDVLVENLEIPWDISFAGNGETFLTERTGRVLRLQAGEVVDATEPRGAIDAGSVPPGSDERSWFVKGGEGGTLGVAVHPSYPEPPLVYVYYTVVVDGERRNRLAYFDASAADPGAATKTLLEMPASNIHNGGRITFGPANYLWVTTGDTGEKQLAADPGSLAGKVLRVTPEGEPAPDNPGFAAPEVYTMGHRNPQGIGWLPDATPVIDEHGPGPDEVNRLVAGGNYGWPAARKPAEYAETEYRRPAASSLIESTTWAPSGSVFYTGSVESLSGRLLVGCLASQRVKAFTLTPAGGDLPPLGETGSRHDADWLDDTYTVTSHDLLPDALGRVRHLEQGPDGALYAVTSNRDGRANGRFPLARDDVLVRIRPA
ncbi:PQQ-dependent sugar dehydrogenase [Halosegnis sp.]|uniref:PQQ-dependent sugar dehydrogenase n=1 Tax=Halosegnis sp. TaxID=2864959 RepID=UPI0035D499E7